MGGLTVDGAEGTIVNCVNADESSAGERWDRQTWPAPKHLSSFESFPVMPETHAVYAATWGSLSLFGLVAATQLLLKRPVKAKPSVAAYVQKRAL